jgi:hypothetical protein
MTAVMAYCLSMKRLEVLLDMIDKMWWWATTNLRVRSGMRGSKEKMDDSDYHVREMCVTKS